MSMYDISKMNKIETSLDIADILHASGYRDAEDFYFFFSEIDSEYDSVRLEKLKPYQVREFDCEDGDMPIRLSNGQWLFSDLLFESDSYYFIGNPEDYLLGSKTEDQLYLDGL